MCQQWRGGHTAAATGCALTDGRSSTEQPGAQCHLLYTTQLAGPGVGARGFRTAWSAHRPAARGGGRVQCAECRLVAHLHTRLSGVGPGGGTPRRHERWPRRAGCGDGTVVE